MKITFQFGYSLIVSLLVISKVNRYIYYTKNNKDKNKNNMYLHGYNKTLQKKAETISTHSKTFVLNKMHTDRSTHL